MNDKVALPVTEMRNPRSMDFDLLSTEQMLQVINAEDRTVADAVATQIPRIAEAVEAATRALAGGGRLIYVGAGSSGRIAQLDAVECPPTFGVTAEQVQAIVAGGEYAQAGSAAELEDDPALGARAVRITAQAVNCSPEDARIWLTRAGGEVKTAIVMARAGVGRERAHALLQAADGAVRGALQRAAAGGPETRS